jgi:ketosteroid isomerase-like protein
MFISRKRAAAAGFVLLAVWLGGTTNVLSAEAEQNEVEAFNKRFLEVTLRMDNAGVTALWAEDGVSLLPGTAPMIGKQTSEWGTTVQVVQPPDGKPAIESHGKILLVLHKEKDGVWRIKQEMWNAGARP